MNVSITLQGIVKVRRDVDFPLGPRVPSADRPWRASAKASRKSLDPNDPESPLSARDQTRSICQDHWSKQQLYLDVESTDTVEAINAGHVIAPRAPFAQVHSKVHRQN